MSNEIDMTLVFLEENKMLWHQILGLIGEKGFRSLHTKDKVEGISNYSLDFDLCEHCVYGKQNRVRFSYGVRREK